MLDPALNLEADLGIDSIKRVEILGVFQQKTGLFQPGDMDRVAGLKSIQQIIDHVTAPRRAPSGAANGADHQPDIEPPKPDPTTTPDPDDGPGNGNGNGPNPPDDDVGIPPIGF